MRLSGRRKRGVHEARRQARVRIVELANGYRGSLSATPYSLRTIHRAVHVVRQRGGKDHKHGALVEAAGFNYRRRGKHDKVLPRF